MEDHDATEKNQFAKMNLLQCKNFLFAAEFPRQHGANTQKTNREPPK